MNNGIKAVSIDSFINSHYSPKLHPEGRGYKFNYIVNKVIITNDGNTSIDDCEGNLVKNGNKLRISWDTKERDKTTINPHSDKELEICALMSSSLSEFNSANDTSLTVNQFQELVNELGIPVLMSPTESGFQSPPNLNRPLQSGKYELFVSGKDSDPVDVRLTIHQAFLDNQGIFVTFDQD